VSSYPPDDRRYPPLGLLAEAGFKKGDFLPLYTLTPTDPQLSTTSTTYVKDWSYFHYRLKWNDIFQGKASQVYLAGQALPGTDETEDFRLRNATDGETLLENTGMTGNYGHWFTLGPVDYTPSSKDSIITLQVELRTSPGANSSSTSRTVVVLGVKI